MDTTTGYPVVHFEIGCKDLESTTRFFTGIFGWTATPAPYSNNLQTNSGTGIDGHIVSLGHEPHQYVTFYIKVDDIPGMLTKIADAGGKKIIGPFPLPNGQSFAWFSDPGGNAVGLLSGTPNPSKPANTP
jgi:predicted enzyme related to lactoylglutathione lyase